MRASATRAAESADATRIARGVGEIAHPLAHAADLDPLLDLVGYARFVLLGEASHGPSEFYTWRTEISRRLIREKGFSFIAVEGDWPDCYRVNRYVKAPPESGRSADDVLHAFERWPTSLWANLEVVALCRWLREHNAEQNALVAGARYDSYEAVLHHTALPDFLLPFARQEAHPVVDDLREPRGHRAIGVVYHPELEEYGNYVPTILPERYDAFIYVDETRAAAPLHMPVRVDGELPETYPSGV